MSGAAAVTDRPADELALERAFRTIHATRMMGLEFLNEQLRVEALGFRDWAGLRIGALVTPWSINLVLLSGPEHVLPPVRRGEQHPWAFPSGIYGFHAHEEPILGAYHQCSLFSPATGFATHDDAAAAARAALEALLVAPVPVAPAPLTRRALLSGA